MNYLILILLLIMSCFILSTMIKVLLQDRSGKLSFLNRFKKGKFAIIFLFAIPLYWIGIYYDGNPLDISFLLSIRSTIDLIVLKFDYDSISGLFLDNSLYKATMYLLFMLVTANAFLFSFSLIGKAVLNSIKKYKIVHCCPKVNIIIGFNEQNLRILKSDKNKNNYLLFANLDNDQKDELFVINKAYCNYSYNQNVGDFLLKIFKRFDNRLINLIINTGDDEVNLLLTNQIYRLIERMKLNSLAIDDNIGLDVYAFGEPENESAFLYFVERSNGCIHYINKYKLIAIDFVNRFPMTKFMKGTHIDYETATIKDNVNMNVIMVGFGKANQQLLMTSIANNQFLTKEGESLEPKSVNYWIYDKEDAINHKNLNHNYFRYKKEIQQLINKEDKYLPLPNDVANIEFIKKNINDEFFYQSIKANLLSTKYDNNDQERERMDCINYLIVSFGTDLENLDLADKLSIKLKEWDLVKHTKVFIRISNDALANQVVKGEYVKRGNMFNYGALQEVVFNINQIIDERMTKMAKMRHLIYTLEHNKKENLNLPIKEIKNQAHDQWYAKWNEVQRMSNVYACLSVRTKLQLLGFDYTDDKEAYDKSDLFIKKYIKDDNIIYSDIIVDNKPVVNYKNEYFDKASVRQTLAIQEHQRWNAYMLSNGFIPASIREIKTKDKTELLEQRKHGNITTFEGLKLYRDLMVECFNKNPEAADVIRYDYQLMDDLVWLLNKNNYKIIEKI
ncbi:MAG: hypothetical protein PHY08_12310 [Candidatus Cloacimonetes bacterium]|nr:hypothetical protein [Candidatus Cloacimonadota bacterium]